MSGKLKISEKEYFRLNRLSKSEDGSCTSESTSRGIADLMQWPERKPITEEKIEEDLAAKLEAEHYLARAKKLQFEQEDDIKIANKIILATKCQAIRDAQVSEKLKIQNELNSQEKKLDADMEKTRIEALKVQERQREARLQNRLLYVTSLTQQILDNEEKRQYEKQIALKEGKKLRELHDQRIAEEKKIARKKEEEHKRVTKELVRMNQALQHRRMMELAHEKMANLRIQHYMVGKAAREAEREKRRQKLRQAQEREVARLRALQERQQEIRERAFNDSVERDQEVVAREWRSKELDALRRRAEMKKELEEDRAKQAAEKERLLALELQREERQTSMVLTIQEQNLIQERQQIERRKQAILLYREALRKQMMEKQEAKKMENIERHNQLIKEWEIREDRQRNLRGVLQLKIEDLRTSKVPDKYIFGVERNLRQLKL